MKQRHAGCYACGANEVGLVSRSPIDLDVPAIIEACGKAPDRLVGVALCPICNDRFSRGAA